MIAMLIETPDLIQPRGFPRQRPHEFYIHASHVRISKLILQLQESFNRRRACLGNPCITFVKEESYPSAVALRTEWTAETETAGMFAKSLLCPCLSRTCELFLCALIARATPIDLILYSRCNEERKRISSRFRGILT